MLSFSFGYWFRFFNGMYLVSDYVRMEVTLVGASWDVVAALWRTELPCARGIGALSGGARVFAKVPSGLLNNSAGSR
eukprot:scaffold39782_cov82-Phaeocystis_antarctica.AAC.2